MRQVGSPVVAIPKIAEPANKDLGFTMSMQTTKNVDLLNRFLSQSSAIDVGDVGIVLMKYFGLVPVFVFAERNCLQHAASDRRPTARG